MEKILEKIRDYADDAHGSQMRKYTPERYIVHPVRVMETCRKYDDSLPVLAAALLHDVLEDTPVSTEELLQFLQNVMPMEQASTALSYVVDLTDVYVKKEYPQWNRRTRKQKELERIVLTSAEAQTIKYADIMDNSVEIAANDPEFAPRYLQESLQILRKADKGNVELRNLAIEIVNRELQQLRDE